MIKHNSIKIYPSTKILINDKIASRIGNKDASVYDFSEEAMECSKSFMGWTDLASNPPYPLAAIEKFASTAKKEHLDQVLLIGEGGSTQAPMTITKYNSVDSSQVKFRVLDSTSPTRIRSTLLGLDPHRTLVLVSSKSGTTIETLSIFSVVQEEFLKTLDEKEQYRHYVAITDPDTPLAKRAEEEKWRGLFLGESTVGGRFSALSVFGLVPAALVGIDLEEFIQFAALAEKQCRSDDIDNPAIRLAAFLYDNYITGRSKVCFLSPKRGRVLGLWIEQLVAESLGKQGQGILPNIEPDPLDLISNGEDRVAVICDTRNDIWDEHKSFESGLSLISSNVPQMNFSIESVEELAHTFVVFEYAVAMCGYLMKVCPFDQPDVASAKSEVLEILSEGVAEADIVDDDIAGIVLGKIECRISKALGGDIKDHKQALKALIKSTGKTDYFAINAFVPFDGEGRRESLDMMRHAIARRMHNVACLEIGPRYLHSTGQLQKGGSDDGVFLIISTDEMKDIELSDDFAASSMAELMKAQAIGDFTVLSERGKRAVHVHLPDNSATTLRLFAEEFFDCVEEHILERE